MVTKCDLVAGFTEYFDDLTQEGRAQVWGVTFPYEQTLSGEAAEAFPAEFDALIEPAERAAVRARSKRSATCRRRTKIFGFPQQMAALRDVLSRVRQRRLRVDALRPADPAARRVLHQRHAGGHADRSAARRDRPPLWRRADAVVRAGRPGQGLLRRAAAQGRVIGESGLAGVNRRLEVQKAALQLGAYAAMALIARARRRAS